jgi:hypothetical protein
MSTLDTAAKLPGRILHQLVRIEKIEGYWHGRNKEQTDDVAPTR